MSSVFGKPSLQAKYPVDSPAFWTDRLERYKGDLPGAMYRVDKRLWVQYNSMHANKLSKLVRPNDRVLDAGCGFGRLLSFMPSKWYGKYTGIDITPAFIGIARATYPGREFIEGDLRNTSALLAHYTKPGIPASLQKRFHWAVCLGMRQMIQFHLGNDYWAVIENQLRLVADKILVLEYGDSGVVI